MRAKTAFFIALASVVLSSACGNDDDSIDDTDSSSLSWELHDTVKSLAYVYWLQKSEGMVHVEYMLDGLWKSTPSFKAEPGPQSQLIIGIPYDTKAQWRVVQENGDTTDGDPIMTGPVPSGLPLGELTISNEDKWLTKGKYLLTSINEGGGWTHGPYWTFIIDRRGRPVWAIETPLEHWTLFSQVAVTKDYILWDEHQALADSSESKVHYAYLDREIKTVDTPGLHHSFVQLPDGTLAWGSRAHADSEALVEKAPDADDETVIWTCADDWPNVASCTSNCVFYNESTDSYLYSFYSNSSIVEIDRKTGESLWWAGTVEKGYQFDPKDAKFNWQHGVSYTEAGTLLVSTRKISNEATCSSSTLVYEYEVDSKSQILKLIWSYDSGVYASTNGDAWRLENGNTLHLVGSAGHVVEVDPKGVVVWRVEFEPTHLLGRGEFIEDLYTLISPR